MHRLSGEVHEVGTRGSPKALVSLARRNVLLFGLKKPASFFSLWGLHAAFLFQIFIRIIKGSRSPI